MILPSFFTLLKSLLLPPGLNICIALLGFWLLFFSKRLGLFVILFAFLFLWILSSPFTAFYLMQSLQNRYPTLDLDTLKTNSSGAILVLGGGNIVAVEYNRRPIVSYETRRRLEYAVVLHNKTHFPILVSGGRTKNAAYAEADIMSDFLFNHFRILSYQENRSRNTEEESLFLAPIIQKKNYSRIYLVTNAWHMPRSVYLFKKAGIEVIPAPMGYYTFDPSYKALISYLPNREALAAVSIALHEYYGIAWYKLRSLL